MKSLESSSRGNRTSGRNVLKFTATAEVFSVGRRTDCFYGTVCW